MAGVSGTIALGLAGYGAYKALTQKAPPPITPPPAPPPVAQTAITDTAAMDAVVRRQRQRAALNASTRNGTLLTGALGVTSPAPVTRKSLLGS